jgi:DNA-binding protein HU-beta
MTKAKIIKEVSEKTGIHRTTVEAIIETYMTEVKEHVIRKESVSFRGFGNFIVKRRAEKLARNISKNTEMILPAHYVPAFRPSKKFSAQVRKTVK